MDYAAFPHKQKWRQRGEVGARLQDVADTFLMICMGIQRVVGDVGVGFGEISRFSSLGGAENPGHHLSLRRRHHDLSDNV